MKMYRSLVFRELKLTRRHSIMMLVLFLLVMALMILPLIMGMRSDVTPDKADISTMILFCAVPLALVGGIAAGTDNGLPKADISAGWKRYSFVLPPTAKQQAVSDLLVKLCCILLFGLVTAVYPLLMYWMTGGDCVLHTLNVYFVTSAAALLIDTAYSYIVMFSRDKNELKIFGLIAFFGAGLILYFFGFFTGDHELPAKPAGGGAAISDEALQKIVDTIGSGVTAICVLAAFAAVCVLYFLVMWRSHERREP